VTVGNAGDLHMRDAGQEPLDLARDVALDDLAVVEIHLHAERGRAHRAADRVRLVLTVQEIARNVAGVDRLDGQRAPTFARDGRGAPEIGHIRREVGTVIDPPRHRVQARTIEDLGIVERALEGGVEFALAPGKGGKAALAARFVARRQVEQHDPHARATRRGGDGLGGMFVGEQELDRAEPVGGGGGESVEERPFLIEEGQIGGEIRHRPRRLAPLGAAHEREMRDGTRHREREDRRAHRHGRSVGKRRDGRARGGTRRELDAAGERRGGTRHLGVVG